MTASRPNRALVVLLAAALTLLFGVGIGALAQNGPPPADATPGAVGTSALVLAALEPAVAPGYRLAVVENTWAPVAYVTRHTHPTAIAVCV